MTLADLLRGTLDVDCDEVWENERTPNTLTGVGVRLHSMGLSVREVAAVLELLEVDRSHGAVWKWTHDLADAQADPRRLRRRRVGCAVGEAVHPVPDRLLRPINAEPLQHGGCFP